MLFGVTRWHNYLQCRRILSPAQQHPAPLFFFLVSSILPFIVLGHFFVMFSTYEDVAKELRKACERVAKELRKSCDRVAKQSLPSRARHWRAPALQRRSWSVITNLCRFSGMNSRALLVQLNHGYIIMVYTYIYIHIIFCYTYNIKYVYLHIYYRT